MSNRLIVLLDECGVEAELVSKNPTVIKIGGREFWFRKTQDDIENMIPLGVTNMKMDFLFASVQNDDYSNAKYLLGDYAFLEKNLKENETLHVGEAQFIYDFQQIVGILK